MEEQVGAGTLSFYVKVMERSSLLPFHTNALPAIRFQKAMAFRRLMTGKTVTQDVP